MLNNCSQSNSARKGLTLVEVVAGMALLASLAAGAVMAYSAHQKQLRLAADRLHAVRVADRLLAAWYSGREQIPRNTAGRVAHEQQTWLWRSQVINRTLLGRVPVETIRVEIFPAGVAALSRPLASVELVVPVEDDL